MSYRANKLATWGTHTHTHTQATTTPECQNWPRAIKTSKLLCMAYVIIVWFVFTQYARHLLFENSNLFSTYQKQLLNTPLRSSIFSNFCASWVTAIIVCPILRHFNQKEYYFNQWNRFQMCWNINYSLKRECRHCDVIFITGCIKRCKKWPFSVHQVTISFSKWQHSRFCVLIKFQNPYLQ